MPEHPEALPPTAALVVDLARERSARLVGITGGVAAGKSTLAAAVGRALDAAVVATDGFLHPNAVLARLGIGHRKGFPESFDRDALAAALAQWRATGAVDVPTYSHLRYDVDDGRVAVRAERLVIEGLHLGHPALGVRDELDLLVHLDAADEHLEAWYLDRFRALRAEAAGDPTAFLHPYRDVPDETMEAMAVQVWEEVNLAVLAEAVRPWAGAADLVLTVGAHHEVVRVVRNN